MTLFQQARDVYNRWFELEPDVSISEAIEALEALLIKEDSTGEVSYLLGLLIYDRECKNHGDTDLALRQFEAATKINVSHYMAHLYAGHCHHDKKRFQEALQAYDQVNAQALRTEYPLWRSVKLLEQKAECLHHLGQVSKAESLFDEVVSFYESASEDELIIPSEALRTLDKSHPLAKRLQKLCNPHPQYSE